MSTPLGTKTLKNRDLCPLGGSALARICRNEGNKEIGVGFVQTWRGVLHRGVYAFIALSIIAAPLMLAKAEGGSPSVEKTSAPTKPPPLPAGVILLDEYGNRIQNTPEPSVAKQAKPVDSQTLEKPTEEPVLETSAEEENQTLTAPVVEKLPVAEKQPMEEAVPGVEPSEALVGPSDVQGDVAETAVESRMADPLLNSEPAMSDLETVWFTAPGGILLRGDEVLAKRGEKGLRNVEGLARAIMVSASPEQMTQIAGLASQLAPDLPYARMEAARALLAKEGWSRGVLVAYTEVFKAIGRNLEASLWLEAFVLRILGWMLALGSMAYLLLVALRSFPLAIHDLSDLAPMKVPAFAAAAMLGFFVLLPVALGEGALGVTLALFVIGVCYAGMKQRIALCAAVVSLLLALHGLGLAADMRLEALGSHSLIKLVNTAFQGVLEPGEVVRLRAEAMYEEDPGPLTREAYAGWLAREGRLEEANALYDQLVEEESSLIPVYLLNNAANLKIRLKKLPEAIALYQQAEAFVTAGFGAPSEQALVLLNLSRAYGDAFQLNKQDEIMHRAQAVSESTVTELLSRVQHETGKTFELLPSANFMQKLLLSEGVQTKGDLPLQRYLAPGIIGGNFLLSSVCFALLFLVAMMTLKWRPQSFVCESCGCSSCPRCLKENSVKHQLCVTCVRLLKRPETVEVNLRIEKIAELKRLNQRRTRKTFVVGLLIPGAAGLLANRPLAGLFSLFAASLLPIVWKAKWLTLPDPYLMGGVDEIVLGVFLAVAALTYLLLLVVLVPLRRKA